MSRTINIVPKKIKGFTKGLRGNIIPVIKWSCDLELGLLDGTTRTMTSYTFMASYKLKKEAVLAANEYVTYIRSKGDFYFI